MEAIEKNILDSISDILSYGLIGLLFLFAFLSYLLLKKEQNINEPRQSILNTIRFFMIINLICGLLAILGNFTTKTERPSNIDWSGIWITETNDLKNMEIDFKQNKNSVEGIYKYYLNGKMIIGKIKANSKKNILIGKWQEKRKEKDFAGTVFFISSSDGKIFLGNHTRTVEDLEKNHLWKGNKVE